jgi:hypothetical protein
MNVDPQRWQGPRRGNDRERIANATAIAGLLLLCVAIFLLWRVAAQTSDLRVATASNTAGQAAPALPPASNSGGKQLIQELNKSTASFNRPFARMQRQLASLRAELSAVPGSLESLSAVGPTFNRVAKNIEALRGQFKGFNRTAAGLSDLAPTLRKLGGIRPLIAQMVQKSNALGDVRASLANIDANLTTGVAAVGQFAPTLQSIATSLAGLNATLGGATNRCVPSSNACD